MLSVTLITVGSLKEQYLRDGIEEYKKRLNGFCKFEIVELKEQKLSDNPSEKEIATALEKEGEEILSLIPQKSYKIALCVEGKQLSSPELADKISAISNEYSNLTFIIGSSFGLSENVKNQCHFRFSISKLTFPHQLMRFIFTEVLYRAFNIQKGTKYHK